MITKRKNTKIYLVKNTKKIHLFMIKAKLKIRIIHEIILAEVKSLMILLH